jgi:RNA polymerase sigma-70 factor (ECF subfamily)
MLSAVSPPRPFEPLDVASLYEAHARQVFRTLTRLGLRGSAVEDAVQDVFLTAHQGLERFERRSSVLTWLLGIAVRVAANARRGDERRGPSLVADESLVDPAVSADQRLERERDLQQLERVLGQLPREQREVVVLVDLEQLTAPQVAEALEVKLNTVYSRLRLGRAALSLALAPRETP